MKKKIICCIIMSMLVSISAFAQYEWRQLASPTQYNLNTGFVTNNGDIYVFGDQGSGFKSSDEGETWENLFKGGVDASSITASAYNEKTQSILVAGDKLGVRRYYTFRAAWGYIEEDVSGHFIVDRIDMDENQNAWYLPLQSKAVAYMYDDVTVGGTKHSRLVVINLPQEGYKYKSALCGNRIIVFTHNLGLGMPVVFHLYIIPMISESIGGK
jgi:hypothetical protein